MSASTASAAFLVVGLVLGAGIVFAATYLNGGDRVSTTTLISKSVSTYTTVETSTATALATTTVTVSKSTTVTGTAQVQAGVVSCNYNNMVSGAEACEIVLTNSGNANTATTGSCSLTYRGETHPGVVTGGGTVAAGSYLTVTCSYQSNTAAGIGTQISGAVLLTNGDQALFSGTASS